MELKDRVVLLTGASRGLGRALAGLLAQRGARIACVARPSDALDATVAELVAAGAEARAFPFDLHDVERCPELAARVEAELGPVSVLVCNAATATVGEVADCETDAYARHLRANVLSSVALTRTLAPGMRARGQGRFVFVLSGVALRPLPAFSTYATAKAALRAFAEALRVELVGTPLGVLTVLPGTLQTEGLARMERAGTPRILAAPRGQPPERVAARIVRGLERDRDRVVVRGPAWLAAQLDHFAPGLTTWLLAHLYRRR